MHIYQNNAFRILGLQPNVSMTEIIQRVNEIKVKVSLGMDVTYDYDFPWMGPLDRREENVLNALQRLENPIMRLKEELFWFWFDTARDKKGINYLIGGNRQKAHSLWREIIVSDTPNKKSISAFVNQAILAHSSVIGKDIILKYKEVANEVSEPLWCPKCYVRFKERFKFCLHCGSELTPEKKTIKSKVRNVNLTDAHWKNWRFALNRFSTINSLKLFWDIVAKKSKRINDPRLSESKLREICDNFLQDIAQANFSFISQALIFKDHERIKQHSNLLNGSSLSHEVLRQGFNKVLSSHVNSLNRYCKNATEDISKTKRKYNFIESDILEIYSKLKESVTDIIYEGNLIDINCVSDFALARDNIARVIRDISVELNNMHKQDNYSGAYELIEKAIEYATSPYIKQKLEKDKEIIKRNLDETNLYKDYYKKSEYATSTHSFNWKPILVWGGIILLFIIGSLSENSSDYNTSPSKTTSYTYNKSSTTSLSELKAKIDNLKRELETKTTRLSELDNDIDFKWKRLSALKNNVESLDREYGNRQYIPDWVRSDYDRQAAEYNRLGPIYNNLVNERQKLYNELVEKARIHDSLVEIYNKRIR